MIATGATYSHRKNARCFAIVLQDWARCRLQLCIECDNALLRSRNTVYAATLICYAGLWCRNKRAYELAEAMRGSVVTWLRRLVTHTAYDAPRSHAWTEDRTTSWHQWVHLESQTRLQWIIYQLDCQYAILMNMSPVMALMEKREWDCLCDEEYWSISSAKHWRALLGRAVVPPSRTFMMVVALFLFESYAFPPMRITSPLDKLLGLACHQRRCASPT